MIILMGGILSTWWLNQINRMTVALLKFILALVYVAQYSFINRFHSESIGTVFVELCPSRFPNLAEIDKGKSSSLQCLEFACLSAFRLLDISHSAHYLVREAQSSKGPVTGYRRRQIRLRGRSGRHLPAALLQNLLRWVAVKAPMMRQAMKT